jgi:uracil phosphoribosyltransferase
MVICLSNSNSIASQYLAEIRDKEIQKDRLRFRRNIERLGEIFGWEISKHLSYELKNVQTQLGNSSQNILSRYPILATILRAGLPLHQGLLNVFDKSDNAFVSAFREYDSATDFHIELDYVATPDLTGKVLILADPMLATGWSLEKVYFELLKYGIPAHTHLVTVIAATQGIEYIQKRIPEKDYTLWTAGIDNDLNLHSYIVPGLGDAGDLAYGPKV